MIGLAVQEAGLHGRVLARRALAVVLVADGDPAHAGVAGVAGDVGERLGGRRAPGSGPARLAGEGVDHAEEEVAGDVLEVAAVLQPRAGGRDVVGGALALGLQQDRQLDEVLAVPRREGLQQLQAIAVGVDDDLDVAPVGWRRLEPASPARSPLAGSSSPTGSSSEATARRCRR